MKTGHQQQTFRVKRSGVTEANATKINNLRIHRHSHLILKPLADHLVPPFTDLSLLDLPKFIITNVFGFLKVEDIVRASLLCCRTLANCGKLDFVWEKEWRTLKRSSHTSLGGGLVPVPPHLNGKLYELCCTERSNRFRRKLEESLKKRRISISTHGPVRALRDLILNDLQKNKSDNGRISMKFVYSDLLGTGNRPLSCGRKVAYSQSDKLSLKKLEISLVNAAQSWKSNVRFSKECRSNRSDVVSLFGAKVFSGALCLKAELPNNYHLMMSETLNRNLISNNNNNLALVNYTLADRRSLSIGYSLLSPSTSGYAMIGHSKGEYSLILESFPICPYVKSPNSSGPCVLGSLAVARWSNSDDPEFVLASIPLALFELVISPFYKLKQAETLTSNQPIEANSIAKFASECAIAVTVRTFDVSLWEFFLSGLEKSHTKEKTMVVDLLECHRRENFPHNNFMNQACSQDVREGLVLHTRAGFQCRIPCATVLDATLFNPEGLPIWSISQPVQLFQTTDNSAFRTNLDISGLFSSEILSATIRDPFTASALKVDFCFGSTVEPIHDQNSKPKMSSFVQSAILELDIDAVQHWIPSGS